MNKRVILHCDANNFFASCECVLNPNLMDKPVAVTGNPEKRTGIILAKNNIAKSFDVVPGITDSGYTEILKANNIKDEEFVVVGQNFVNPGALLQVINHK